MLLVRFPSALGGTLLSAVFLVFCLLYIKHSHTPVLGIIFIAINTYISLLEVFVDNSVYLIF